MKVSIITTCYNSAATIEETIRSVVKQTYSDIEYIIIDGGSTDGTLAIVEKYKQHISKIRSEKDHGIYDALNKGIDLATGEIVAILHSDDFYVAEDVIHTVVKLFKTESCDCVYADLQYVKQDNPHIIVRTWIAGAYSHGLFLKGWMPPHPVFFVASHCYKQYGKFNLQLKSAADYELMLRFMHKYRIKAGYIPRVLVKMRTGGKSNASVANRIKANREDRLAWKLNGLKPNLLTLILKPLSKLKQFWS